MGRGNWSISAWDYVDSHEQDLANVAVGIMDDGVDAEHEEFPEKRRKKFTGWKITKKIWHLTMAHVTGLISAENNQAGIRGWQIGRICIL